MSAPVDVHKAMRVAEAYCYDAGASNAAKNLRAASAAVAELIEAATLHLNKIGCGTSLDCEYCDRLRAALAEMGGKV